LPEEDSDDMDNYDIANQYKRVDIDHAIKAAKESNESEDTSGIKFEDGAYDTLAKLQGVLGPSDEDAGYKISVATTDNWRSTALSALVDTIVKTKTPAKGWEIIQSREKELYPRT
jgi:hypothetical protein